MRAPRRQLSLVVLLVLVGAVMFSQSVAQDRQSSPADLFRKAVRPTVAYEGSAVIITHQGSETSTIRFRIYHTADDLLRRDYVVADGKRHDVFIQSPSWFIFWRADADPVTVRKYPVAIPPESFQNVDLILRNYDVLPDGSETLAGRPALKFRLRSRQGLRPEVRLWLDAENSVILREVRLDLAGRLLVERSFEEVRFPVSLDPALFQPPAGAQVEDMTAKIAPPKPVSSSTPASQLDDLRRALPGILPLPARVPTGFELISVTPYFYSASDPSAFVVHLGYHDGLSALSVFIQHDSPGQDANTDQFLRNEKGELAKPATLTYEGLEVADYSRAPQTILRCRRTGFSVTVIGQIDRADLLRTLASVKLAPAPDK